MPDFPSEYANLHTAIKTTMVGLNPIYYTRKGFWQQDGSHRWWVPDLSDGVTQIQAEGVGDTIGTALPLSIYVPPGIWPLAAPLTLTRHNTTLIIDAGAQLVPPDDEPAIVFDGSQTPETYLKNWGLFMYGVIWGTNTGTGQHGVHLLNAVNGKFFANEIRACGGDGLRFDGSCFSNFIHANRIHGCTGWGINSTAANHVTPNQNTTVLTGEVQTCTAGGANLRRWNNASIDLRFENFAAATHCLVLDSVRAIEVRAYFENPLAGAGDDIRVLATDYASQDVWVEGPTTFLDQKTSGYNINLTASTINNFYLNGCRASFQTSLFLFGGTGNTNCVLMPTANFDPTAVTNNMSTELKTIATEAF